MNLFSISHLWRQMARHWRLYGLVLVLLTVVAALLGSIPLVARQMATLSLQQSLAAMPVAGRNVLLRGERLGTAVASQLQTELGDVYLDQIEMRDMVLPAATVIQRPEGVEEIDKALIYRLYLHLYSFSNLDEMVTVVDGRLPQTAPENATVIEVAVGQPAAALLDLQVGDVLFSQNRLWQFQIVGIVAATDPQDEFWWGDDQLLPLSIWKLVSPDFVEGNSGLLLHPEALHNNFVSQRSWRILLDQAQIDAVNAAVVADKLRRLESSLSSSSIALDTGLIARLDQFVRDIEQGQLALLLLVSQSLLAVLYTLAMLGQAVLAQAAGEIATLSARGHGSWQVTRQFAVRYGLLALVAWPLGVKTAVTLWPQPTIPLLSWGLAAMALLFAFFVLVGPVPGVAGRGLLVWMQGETRPESARDWARRLVWDGAVLGLGALSYWQLRQFSRQALAAGEAITLDPLLLLSPTILILGFALLLRHVVPLLIRLVAWLSRRSPALLLPLALAWLGQDVGRSGRIIFLVSMASGLALFAAIFTDSLTARQAEMAWYGSGADVRWSVMQEDLATVTAALADEDVAATTTVFRGSAVPVEIGSPINLLAVAANANSVIAPYPADVGSISRGAALALLANPAEDAVPVLLSRRNVVPGTAVGDRLIMRVGVAEVPVEVRGIIEAFATLREPFVVMSLDGLRPYLDSQAFNGELSRSYEVWADVDGERLSVNRNPITDYGSLITDFGAPLTEPRLLSDAAVLRAQYGSHLLSQQILGVFRLNVWVLVGLSFVSLLGLQWLDGWRRRPSWGTLMTIGLSRQEVARVMINEGLALVGVGLVVGVGLGLALARITLPLLALTLSASMGGSETAPLLLNWLHLGRLLLTMTALYGVAIIIPAWAIGRVEMGRLLRWQV